MRLDVTARTHFRPSLESGLKYWIGLEVLDCANPPKNERLLRACQDKGSMRMLVTAVLLADRRERNEAAAAMTQHPKVEHCATENCCRHAEASRSITRPEGHKFG